MSEWTERFKNHRVHGDLSTARAALAKARAAAEDATHLEAVVRASDVVRFLSSRLSRVDPNITPVAPLNALATSVQGIANELNSFSGNKNPGHLANANTHADNLLVQALDLPLLVSKEDVEGVHDSVVRFRRSVGQHLSRLEKRISALGSELTTLEGSAKERADELSSAKGRLDNALQQFTTSSTEAERKRSSEFADVIAEAKQQTADTITAAKDEVLASADTMTDELDEKAQRIASTGHALVAELEDYRDQASSLVGVIARTGMAGGYQEIADQEQRQANLWRWIALAGLVGFVGFAIVAMVGALDNADFLAKTFVSFTFAVLAGYAGREAEKHRNREDRNRRVQLDLASLEPFMAKLPEERRHAIKIALADRMFGRADERPISSDGSQPIPSIVDVLRLIGLPGSGGT